MPLNIHSIKLELDWFLMIKGKVQCYIILLVKIGNAEINTSLALFGGDFSCVSVFRWIEPLFIMNFRYTKSTYKINNQQRAFYEENGYLLIRNNVDDKLLDRMTARFVEICEDENGSYVMTIHRDPSLKKKGAKGQYLINKLQDFAEDEILWEYCSDNNVLDIVESIIGPNITAVHTMLINKPPDADPDYSLHPLHQDLHYFPFRPADTIVTAWTAMEKIDEKNGCLYVVPGSHLKGILYEHVYPDGKKHTMYHGVHDMGHLPRLNVEMNKGDTLFFHPLLLHGSGPNLTKNFRKAISCHYADTNSTFIDVTGTTQQNIGEEVVRVLEKRGIRASFADIWKIKSRLARGPPGNFQSISSHL